MACINDRSSAFSHAVGVMAEKASDGEWIEVKEDNDQIIASAHFFRHSKKKNAFSSTKKSLTRKVIICRNQKTVTLVQGVLKGKRIIKL